MTAPVRDGPVPASMWMAGIHARVHGVLESLAAHIAAAEWSPPSEERLATPPPWVLFPIWLDEAWRTDRSRAGHDHTLAEILWGQYALFLYIRIQDDLLDGQQKDLRMLFAADRFLLESVAAFRGLPLNEEFHRFYFACLHETVHGVLEVLCRESTPGQFQKQDLGLHAQVGAIFRVGVAAVCQLHGRAPEFSRLSALLDQVAVFSQLGDDLKDAAGDLQVGRFTWVANVLLGVTPGEVMTSAEQGERLGMGLRNPERGLTVLAELRRTADAALDLLPNSAPPALRDWTRQLGHEVEVLDRCMHEARVRDVFGPVLP